MADLPARNPRSRFIREVMEAQVTLLRAFHEQPVPQWLTLDLTLGQLRAMFILFQAGPTPVGQLGAQLGIGRPAASLLVDALVRQGLAERFEDPADRRRTLTRLSPTAQGLITENYLGNQKHYEELLGQLGDEELAHLAHGLSALANVVVVPGASEAAS